MSHNSINHHNQSKIMRDYKELLESMDDVFAEKTEEMEKLLEKDPSQFLEVISGELQKHKDSLQESTKELQAHLKQIEDAGMEIPKEVEDITSIIDDLNNALKEVEKDLVQ